MIAAEVPPELFTSSNFKISSLVSNSFFSSSSFVMIKERFLSLRHAPLSARPPSCATFFLASFSMSLSKSVEVPCSRAPPRSATPVALTEHFSAADDIVTTCFAVNNFTRSLLPHQKFLSRARLLSFSTVLTQAAKWRNGWAISIPAICTHETLGQ